MAVRLTITKAIEAAVEEAAAKPDCPPWVKDLAARIVKAKLPRRPWGLTWDKFVDIAAEELGDRLALPEVATPAWKAKINNQLAALGMSADGARRACQVAKRALRGPIQAEYLIARSTGFIAQTVYRPPEEKRADEGNGGFAEFQGDE